MPTGRDIYRAWFRFVLAGDGISMVSARMFFLSAATGVVVGFCASAFHWMIDICREYLLQGLAHHKTLLQDGRILADVFNPVFYKNPETWILLVLPAAGAAAAALLIKFFSPSAHARGTDSAIFAYHRMDGRIPSSVIPVKSAASAIVIGSGGSAGYEGPMTLIGAACGSKIARMLRLDAKTRRIMMACGLAAGLGALFRCPLAGAIFGAEIFYSSTDMEYEVFLPSFVATSVAYCIFACFHGTAPLFHLPNYVFDTGLRLVPYIALAFITAFGARLYIRFFRTVESAVRKWKFPNTAKIACGGLLTGLTGMAFPDILGNGYQIIEKAFSLPDNAALTMGALLFTLFILKIAATAFTVGFGGSGGVFGPALVMGAALGASTGIILAKYAPASFGIHPAEFALVGMAGFIAAAIRVPLAAIVMVSELSGNHYLIVPTMWVCGISFLLNDGWTLYRSQVRYRSSSPLHTRRF